LLLLLFFFFFLFRKKKKKKVEAVAAPLLAFSRFLKERNDGRTDGRTAKEEEANTKIKKENARVREREFLCACARAGGVCGRALSSVVLLVVP